MKWSIFVKDIKSVSATVAGIGVIVAFFFGIYSHFYTDAEAAVHIEDFENYQQQQLKSDKYDRVDRIQREIDRIDYQLLDIELPQHKREYLLNKRKDLEKKIDCIRENSC